MKGVKKENEKKKAERDSFIRELFLADCAMRARKQFKTPDGLYYLEPLSGPKAQEAYRKKYRVTLNSNRLFKIRREIWAVCGLDSEGRPKAKGLAGVPQLKPAANGQGLTAAARDPNDPLFNVAIIPIEDETQGVFLKTSIEKLGERGLVDKELRVDGIHTHYATVSRFPKELPTPAT